MAAISTKNRPERREQLGWALGIFAFALLVRAVHIWQLRSAPFFAFKMGDAQAYDQWAQQIAAGDWWGSEVFYQAPLYPYFLGIIYTILGDDLLTVRSVQAVTGATACVLLAAAGWRLFSKPVGIVAGFMLALYAPAIFFDALIQKSVLDLLLFCLALWLVSGLLVEPRGSRWCWLGVSLGALVLTRENALVIVVAVLIWLFLHFANTGKRRLGYAGLFLAGLGLVLMPVAMRNRIVGEEFHLTTSQFGPNFFIGNNERANGTYSPLRFGRGEARFERQDATELAETALGRKLSPAEVSSYFTRRALNYISSQPGSWLKLIARKFALTWNAAEIVDTEDQDSHAKWSLPLRLTGYVWHFGVLTPLALLGIWTTWHDRNRLWLLYLMLALYTASVVMFYVFGRYRFPLVPPLTLFAAAAVVQLRGFVRDSSTARIAAPAAATLALAVLCNWPMVPKHRMQATIHLNLAVQLDAADKLDEAIAELRESLRIQPNYAQAHYNLGAVLLKQKKYDEAAREFKRAVRANPDYAEAHFYLSTLLLAKDDPAGALEHLRRAIKIRPDYTDAHFALGNVLMRQRKFDQAAAEFQRVTRAKPELAEAHFNLGVAMLGQRDWERAAARFERAIQIETEYVKAYVSLGMVRAIQGDFDGAAAQLEQAIRINPDSTATRNDLGVILLRQKKFAEAAAQFERVLRIRPDFVPAQKNLEIARTELDNHK